MAAQPKYYTNLPANIRYDNTLPFGARVLYSEIATLANKSGKCWATNSYFARLFNTTSRNVSRWVSLLASKGYIKVTTGYADAHLAIEQRCIFLSTPHDNLVHTPTPEISTPHRQECHTPHDKNVHHNNINNNNIKDNNINDNNIISNDTCGSVDNQATTITETEENKKTPQKAPTPSDDLISTDPLFYLNTIREIIEKHNPGVKLRKCYD